MAPLGSRVLALAVAGVVLLCATPPARATLCTEARCEYHWTVGTQLTLNAGSDYRRAYVHQDGTLWWTSLNGTQTWPIPQDRIKGILLANGHVRPVTVINNQLPGPTIEVVEGATVVVHVTNNLENEATTIHWHGMYQRGTPHMDGTSKITQCPIQPQTSFTYEFVAEPAGTHGYHAHHGVERSDGLFGALIVHGKKTPNLHTELCDSDNHVMVLSDWDDQSTLDMYWRRVYPGIYPYGFDKPQYVWTRGTDGKLLSEDPFSILVNGVGRSKTRFGDTETWVNFTRFHVAPESVVCFRVVGAMMERAFRVSVDQHELLAFSADGHDFRPVNISGLVISPGETYDFAIRTKPLAEANGGQFWLRVESLETGYGFHSYTAGGQDNNHTGFAIIRYDGATDPRPEPGTLKDVCTASRPCREIGCPYPQYPAGSFRSCIPFEALENADPTDLPPEFPAAQQMEYFTNYFFRPLGVNGRRFVTPTAPLLTQFNESGFKPCETAQCDTLPGCNCTHTLNAPFNTSLQLVFANVGPTAFAMHPIHVHGHSFHVLKVGYGTVNATTALLASQNTDVVCENPDFCTQVRWANGTAPAFNVKNPIRKDTIVVPPWGYAVVRLVTDNPGMWFVHCHMTTHLYYGMGWIINEAPEKQHLFPAPADFPRCGDWAAAPASGEDAAQARRRAWAHLQ